VQGCTEQIDEQAVGGLCSAAAVIPIIHLDDIHTNQATFCGNTR